MAKQKLTIAFNGSERVAHIDGDKIQREALANAMLVLFQTAEKIQDASEYANSVITAQDKSEADLRQCLSSLRGMLQRMENDISRVLYDYLEPSV